MLNIEDSGFHADEYATPDCPHCNGTGRKKEGNDLTSYSICPCVLLAIRQKTADLIIKKNFPKRAQKMSLANFNTGGIVQNERALKVARNFFNNWNQAKENGWVIGFFGQPRSGKTHLAISIARACTKRYLVRPQFLNLPEALRTERERYSNPDLPSALEAAKTAELLILDDLGAEYEKASNEQGRVSWLTEQLYSLLEARYMNQLPTIYTTNLTPGDMEARYSESEAWKRVYSRLTTAQVTDPIQVFLVPDAERRDPEAEKLLLS
jgi:DNA replication protein DnaC